LYITDVQEPFTQAWSEPVVLVVLFLAVVDLLALVVNTALFILWRNHVYVRSHGFVTYCAMYVAVAGVILGVVSSAGPITVWTARLYVMTLLIGYTLLLVPLTCKHMVLAYTLYRLRKTMVVTRLAYFLPGLIICIGSLVIALVLPLLVFPAKLVLNSDTRLSSYYYVIEWDDWSLFYATLGSALCLHVVIASALLVLIYQTRNILDDRNDDRMWVYPSFFAVLITVICILIFQFAGIITHARVLYALIRVHLLLTSLLYMCTFFGSRVYRAMLDEKRWTPPDSLTRPNVATFDHFTLMEHPQNVDTSGDSGVSEMLHGSENGQAVASCRSYPINRKWLFGMEQGTITMGLLPLSIIIEYGPKRAPILFPLSQPVRLNTFGYMSAYEVMISSTQQNVSVRFARERDCVAFKQQCAHVKTYIYMVSSQT